MTKLFIKQSYKNYRIVNSVIEEQSQSSLDKKDKPKKITKKMKDNKVYKT